MGFILWRRAKGYKVTRFKREFWGKKSWHKNHKSQARRIRLLAEQLKRLI